MQDAFLKLLERWERVGGAGRPGRLPVPNGHESVPQAVEEGVGHARRTVGLSAGGDEISLIETRVDVVRAVASLSPRQRAVVVLTAARPRPAGRDRSTLGQGMGCEARSPWPVGVPRPPGVPPVRSDHASGGRVRIAPPR